MTLVNPLFKPGKSRKKSGFSRQVKDQILAEFHHECVLCGAWVPGTPDNFHHIHARGMGGDPTRITDSWWNCALLCLDCHGKVEGSQKLKLMLRAWSDRRREQGRQDGIVPSRRLFK